jgi:hypothetical protein
VSRATPHLAHRIRRLDVVLEPKTLPSASCHRAAGERATPRAATTPVRAQRAGRIHGWTGPPSRGPAGLPADRAWQAIGPRTVATGQFWPDTVR